MKIPFFPTAASTGAVRTDHAYFMLLILSVIVLAIVFGTMAACLFKYRRGKKANRAPLKMSTMKIEVTWTIIPLIIAMGIFAWGAEIYFYQEVAPPGTLEMNVVGKQWMWKVQHAEGNREINELHVPVNRAIRLTLASEDVIHSFYIPAFRIKQDVVPGRFTTEWFHPTRTGEYPLYCSEYCGTDHSKMRGTVVVMSPADYEQWLSRGSPHNTLAQSGEMLFRQLGCSGCHVGNAAIHAPPLEGLYGRLVPLTGGGFVRADDKYIRDSILLPASQVVNGYQPLMPAYTGRIREEELLQVIAYIKSLGNQKPPDHP